MVELSGDYEFKAPQELVWGMLLDPDVLAMTIAGCEKLERVDENTFQGRLNIKVGPVQGIFQGKVETTNLHPPTSFHMVVNGSGPAGVVRGEGDMTLENLQSVTRLRYDGNVHISGRIASVGLDSKVAVWDAEKGEPLSSFQVDSPDGHVVSADFSADGRRLILGWVHGQVSVWDLDGTPRQTSVFKAAHPESVSSVSIAPDGTWAASCAPNGTLRLYEPAAD